MQRTIVDFHLDARGDWVADLDCGHGQHARHRPPFVNRPWVVGEAGRESMLGAALECVRCDRMEWPQGLRAFRRTPEWDGTTLPDGLKRDHATKRGVWGRIHVVSGTLVYRVGEPVDRCFRITSASSAIIVPEVRHCVAAEEAVRFFVEFWKR